MVFRLPSMPLTIDRYQAYTSGGTKYGLFTSQFLGNLSQGKRTLSDFSEVTKIIGGITCYGLVSELLCPKLQDVRPATDVAVADLLEIPAGSKRLYVVLHVDDVAKGFANEYRIVFCCRVAQAVVFTTSTVAVPSPLP